MRKFMLDTNIASYAIKGRSRSIAARMAEFGKGRICISVIAEAELKYGLQDFPDHHSLHSRVHEFLVDFPPVPWDGDAPGIYAKIKRKLERAGIVLEDLDMMLAAHAISMDAVFVTNNMRHFERIGEGLRLANWYEG